MTHKHIKGALAAAAMALAAPTAGQIPVGYYEDLRGKSGSELKTAVSERISQATVLRYGSGTGRTWDGFYRTDRTPDGRVVDRYSNELWYFGEPAASVSGMNIEHSFPKSWWGGAENQAYRDLYNLMPCEQRINSSKSNYPMGTVATASTDNGCTKVGVGTDGFRVWEPDNRWKGDFARGYMYMATAYQDLTWQGTQALQLLENGPYPTLQQWAQQLYMGWARADMVDSIEVARNDSVAAIQGNRNPFVDFPNLMEYIWGDSTTHSFDPSLTMATSPYYATEGDMPAEPLLDTLYAHLFTASDGSCTIATDMAPTDGFDVWTRSSQYGWTATAHANSTNHAADATLWTPEIDLRRVTTATLTMEHAANYVASPSEAYSVLVSHDGMTWQLTDIAWPSGSNWQFVSSGGVSLDEHAGRVVRIGLRYTSTADEAGTWEIRRMTVVGTPEPSGISDAKESQRPAFDATQPHEVFTMDGRRIDNISHAKGIVIVRQKGHVWKMAR